MIGLFITFILVFIATTLFGHVAHWSLHQSWLGRFNLSHMTHHLKLYPPSDFMSDSYRDPGKDNTVYIFAMAGLPLLMTPIILWFFGIISLITMVFALAEMLLIGLMHDRIHDSFHIDQHFFNHLPLYKKWWELHYQHHVDMGTNYGIFTYFWDKVFKTYKEKK